MTRPNLIVSILHLLGIVTLRFKPVPRIWATWLMAVNLAAVAFLGRIEGQVAFTVAGVAVLAMALIYQRNRFTRVLGICHILWVPMIAWLVWRWDRIQTDPTLATWITLMIASNVVALVIDVTDVTRFLKGERKPFYAW